jgi:anti-anti-sigma factor
MDPNPGQRPSAGSITIDPDGDDRWVLRLRGEVDTAVAARFTREQGRERVAVDAIDAGAVTFISSSGLALMLLTVEASVGAGRHPVLRAVSRPVDRALRQAGVEGLFPRPRLDRGPPPPAGGVDAGEADDGASGLPGAG